MAACLFIRAGRSACLAVAMTMALAGLVHAQTSDIIVLRGHRQTMHLYGPRQGDPVIVSSGDGGWMHLGPHVADVLAMHGFFVVGFDVKAYLESFTSGGATLRAEDEPGDYGALVEYARRATGRKPVLVGVSEGAGLSVLAAADAALKIDIGGVIGLGLPDVNELGWRWQDSVIYFTHGAPKEPSFHTADLIGRIAPVPLGAIHSTSDEFVPLDEIRRVLGQAAEPTRLWIVKASNHRFSDNLPEFDQRLLQAMAWARQHEPPQSARP